jgi:hypothetical protein
MGNKTSAGPLSTMAAVKVRSSVTTTDSTTINDTNFDPTTATATHGWKSVQVFPRFTGGTAPSCTVQVLYRMTSISGNGWALGPAVASLTEGQATAFSVFGRDVFFMVTALGGTPTHVDLWCAGWEAVQQTAGPAR